MGFQAASTIFSQTIPFIFPVLLALLGYWITKRNQLELTRWRERLDLIDDRLNSFYGPLYVLSEVGYMSYKTLIDKMGGEDIFRKEPIDEDVLHEWQIWVENIFVPLNKESEDLIVKNAHLIREEEFPESLFLFIMHASLYKAMVAKWKQGDYREYLPKIDYPFELREYATKSYQELKHEQLQLIGKMKPRTDNTDGTIQVNGSPKEPNLKNPRSINGVSMRRRSILLLLVVALSVVVWQPGATSAQDERCFPETGQCLRGPLLAYWEHGGGLAMFGFPISGELWEDGRVVQYFERNRFEIHPEYAGTAYEVQMGLLGAERLRAAGRDWQAQQPGIAAAGCRYFAETRHTLWGQFLEYWEQHGGLAIFGLPLTEPADERNEFDGRFYRVQYFERNRFELHPENPAPYDVLLGLLGSWRANWLLAEARTPAAMRASLSGTDGVLSPFDPLTLTIAAPGYDGPAELRVYDGAGRPEARALLAIANGAATLPLTAGGALGSHPAVLLIDGRVAGITSAAYQLDAQTSINTGQQSYDALWPAVHALQERNVSSYTIDGQLVRGHRSPDSDLIWLRDLVYQSLGYRYFERDMTSALDYFRRSQHADGSFDDYFAVHPWGKTEDRVQIEADPEFLFAQGVYQAWQATGDDGWLNASLPAIDRGLAYSTSDPQRWEASIGLVKRPFTIDMWDFEYGGPAQDASGRPVARRWIDDQTRWSVMHGDNTGLAYAMRLRARIAEQQGDWGAAADWSARADGLMQRLNNTSWNGYFYTHQVHLAPVIVPGLDENRQLSLSNAYALNRQVLSFDQATAILGEYQARRAASSGAFAEWFSIDPPFPPGSFGSGDIWGDQPGAYVNGGIMPLVGGELARGAFHWGQESYGFDILRRYKFMLSEQGGSYLWYYPAGNPGISGTETTNSDGWGSAAMLAALLEGAAGITDQAALYRDVVVAPRWAADPTVTTAAVTMRYGASYGYLSYRWERLPQAIHLTATGSAERGTLRVLLPPLASDHINVSVAGVAMPFALSSVGASRYVQLPLTPGALVELAWS